MLCTQVGGRVEQQRMLRRKENQIAKFLADPWAPLPGGTTCPWTSHRPFYFPQLYPCLGNLRVRIGGPGPRGGGGWGGARWLFRERGAVRPPRAGGFPPSAPFGPGVLGRPPEGLGLGRAWAPRALGLWAGRFGPRAFLGPVSWGPRPSVPGSRPPASASPQPGLLSAAILSQAIAAHALRTWGEAHTFIAAVLRDGTSESAR